MKTPKTPQDVLDTLMVDANDSIRETFIRHAPRIAKQDITLNDATLAEVRQTIATLNGITANTEADANERKAAKELSWAYALHESLNSQTAQRAINSLPPEVVLAIYNAGILRGMLQLSTDLVSLVSLDFLAKLAADFLNKESRKRGGIRSNKRCHGAFAAVYAILRVDPKSTNNEIWSKLTQWTPRKPLEIDANEGFYRIYYDEDISEGIVEEDSTEICNDEIIQVDANNNEKTVKKRTIESYATTIRKHLN